MPPLPSGSATACMSEHFDQSTKEVYAQIDLYLPQKVDLQSSRRTDPFSGNRTE